MNRTMLSKLLFVLIINILISYPFLYSQYKHYDMIKFPQDSPPYMIMSQTLIHNDVAGPWKYRLLTPFIVRTISFVPAFPTRLTSELDAKTTGVFFRFFLVNYLWIVFTSALLFYLLYRVFNIPFYLSHLMGLFFIFSFANFSNGLLPITDAGAYFFITLLFILMLSNKPVPLFFVSLIGIMQKETVFLAIGFILLLKVFHDKQYRLFFRDGLLLLPSLGLFWFSARVLDHMNPSVIAPWSTRYSLATLFQGVAASFDIHFWNSDFITQVGLAFLPLLIALLIHGYFLYKKEAVEFPMIYLIIFPFWVILGIVLNIGPGNIGRICSFGFPIYLIYQAKIIEKVMRLICIGQSRE